MPTDRLCGRAKMAPDAGVIGFAEQVDQCGDQRGCGDDAEYDERPIRGGRAREPAQQHDEGERQRHEAAPQVVEYFPLRQQRQRVAPMYRARPVHRHARVQPGGNLPVAADPAVAAADVRGVVRRILLVQLHVAQQRRARIAALQQVVTQDAIFGKAILQRALERVDVVDALADERTFAEQVLVDVGDGARIRINPGLGAEEPRIARAIRARQAHRHARLHDAVARGHALARGVVVRAVQRVRHRTHELAGRIARQLGVGIERDHVLDAR